MTIISQNLKRLQKLKELTISQLAEKSGVSVRTIERIRSGKHVPDLHTITLLAKALGQKPEHLVEGAMDRFTKAEVKEILKRAKDPKSNYITLEEAQAELSKPGCKRLAKDMRKTLKEDRPDECRLIAGAVCNKHSESRKDFTRFEREYKPKELTGWAKDLKDLLELIDREHKESRARVEKAKRQIIWAVCLTAAFLFGLYVLIPLLSNPWL